MADAVVDANVLLRYLTDEPRTLAERAGLILETAQQRREPLVVTALTLAEVVYVLESVYEWERALIVDGVLGLLSTPALSVLEPDVIEQALGWYRANPSVHFADAYIAAVSVARGSRHVVSFDRALRRLKEIVVIDSVDKLP